MVAVGEPGAAAVGRGDLEVKGVVSFEGDGMGCGFGVWGYGNGEIWGNMGKTRINRLRYRFEQ